MALIEYCAELLRGAGARVELIADRAAAKANLFASLGPQTDGGVLLSGHTDVVPVTGQDWQVPPFELTARGGRLYGRGTADMKGFVASALAAALRAGAGAQLATPLHLALSYDEEIGCVGVRSMIEMLAKAPFRPRLCIVGEPTQMRIATGHKGKTAARLTATGQESHSALAPNALNAIHMLCDMIGVIRQLQADIAARGGHEEGYEIGYSTLHVGTIEGGVALNIVPNKASFTFELRNLARDDPEEILALIEARAQAYLRPLRKRFAGAAIEIEVTNSYPPLRTDPRSDVVRVVAALIADGPLIKVAFGTEGGLFARQLGLPTVVCGPGSMAQGHRPDEFIERAQLGACDAMMEALLARLRSGDLD